MCAFDENSRDQTQLIRQHKDEMHIDKTLISFANAVAAQKLQRDGIWVGALMESNLMTLFSHTGVPCNNSYRTTSIQTIS